MTPQPRWVLVDGTAHYMRHFHEWDVVVTWCGLSVPPAFIREPKARDPWCRRCTDLEARREAK